MNHILGFFQLCASVCQLPLSSITLHEIPPLKAAWPGLAGPDLPGLRSKTGWPGFVLAWQAPRKSATATWRWARADHPDCLLP